MNDPSDPSDPIHDGSRRPRTVIERLKERLDDLVEDARVEISSGVQQGREELEALADRRREEAADEVAAVADQLRDSAVRLELRDSHRLGQIANGWADRVEDTARYVRDRPGREIARDLRRFARRRPGLFVAASFASGVVLARFLKSSGERARRAKESDVASSQPSASASSVVEVPEFDVVVFTAGVS